MNTVKFDIQEHQELLIKGMTVSARFPYIFITNPLWLANGPYFICRYNVNLEPDENGELFTLEKVSQIYGNHIKYFVSLPFATTEETKVLVKPLFEKLRKDFPDQQFLLTQFEFSIVDMECPLTKPDFEDFVYTYDHYDFGDMSASKWKSWRQSLKKTEELLTVKYSHNQFPFLYKAPMEALLKEWVKHREVNVGRHAYWYLKGAQFLDNFLITTFWKGSKLVSYNISQTIGEQIFFLDEKTTRSELPNSFTISKAYHILCYRKWEEIYSDSLVHPFFMNSGLGGSPKYNHKHGGKTFDLSKHKTLLQPTYNMAQYKI